MRKPVEERAKIKTRSGKLYTPGVSKDRDQAKNGTFKKFYTVKDRHGTNPFAGMNLTCELISKVLNRYIELLAERLVLGFTIRIPFIGSAQIIKFRLIDVKWYKARTRIYRRELARYDYGELEAFGYVIAIKYSKSIKCRTGVYHISEYVNKGMKDRIFTQHKDYVCKRTWDRPNTFLLRR